MKKLLLACCVLVQLHFIAQYNVYGVPYFYQYNNSINPGGSCQNTSISMLLKFYGASTLTPDKISNQYGTSQAQTVSGFNMVCNSVAQSYGLGNGCVSTSNGSFQGIRNLLSQGKPVVVHGYFTSYGHVMIVTGFTGTHYICNDPAGQWTQVYQGGYTGSSTTVGNQIQYAKAAFEQAIGPDNTLWFHYFNPPPCSTPSGLTALNITSSGAKMKWNQVSNASSYNVRYRKTGTTNWTIALSYYNEYTVSGLLPSTSYEFQVQTKCGATLGTFSSSSTYTTLPPPCGNPTNVTTSNVTASTAQINWTGTSYATNYVVRYKLLGSTTWSSVSTASTSIVLSGLTHTSNYEYQVQTTCNSNSSGSVSGSFNTLAPPPVTLQIGNGTTTYSGHPYGSSFMDERSQYILTKSELIAAGWSAQTPVLKSISFQVSSSSSTSLGTFTVRISHTTANNYANTSFLAGTTAYSTYSGTVSTTNGWNTYTFATPFNYNETMNLVITISFNNSVTGTNSIVQSTILNEYKSIFRRENLASSSISSSATGTRSYYRPNMKLTFGPASTSTTKSLQIETSLEDKNTVLEAKKLLVFPNPMQETNVISFLTDLDSDYPAQIGIFDNSGRVIHQTVSELQSENGQIISLPTALTEGIYFIRIQTESEQLTERFLINK